MTTLQRTIVLGMALAASGARAEPVSLSFEQAIYQDAKEAPLRNPEGVACRDGAALVVADTGNKRLVSYPFKDGRVGAGTEVKLAQLTYPVRLQLDSKGNVVALDGKTRKLVRLDAKGAFVGTLEPKGTAGASSVAVGAFKLDAADNVFLIDVAGRRVLVLAADGAVSRQIDLPKTGQFTDLAVDLAGTIYVVDAVGAEVWSAAKSASAFALLAKGLKDRISFPSFMTTTRGKLLLVDQNGAGVVILGLDGSYQGRQLAMGWNDGLVYYPAQLCVTEAGAVFVADRYNNRVQQFTMAR